MDDYVMKVYVIQQAAVYTHDLFGVFSTKEAAVKAAKSIIGSGDDGHHDYEIVEFDIDVIPDYEPSPGVARVQDNPSCVPKVVETLNAKNLVDSGDGETQ